MAMAVWSGEKCEESGTLESYNPSLHCPGLQLLQPNTAPSQLPTFVLRTNTPGRHSVDRALAGGGHVVEAEDVTDGGDVEHGAGEDDRRVTLDDPLLSDIVLSGERAAGLTVDSDLVLLEDTGRVGGLHHQALTW